MRLILFVSGPAARKKGSLMHETVSTKFKTQLGQLMSTIGATNVQYVRCLKPNPVKSKDVFTMQMVVEQLRCAGVIEAIRISRAGFPHKISHSDFLERFGLLSSGVSPGFLVVHFRVYLLLFF
jgi:myosin-5